jgi:hypothetical protein
MKKFFTASQIACGTNGIQGKWVETAKAKG